MLTKRAPEWCIAAFAAIWLGAGMAQGQGHGFDPEQPCAPQIAHMYQGEQLSMAAWALGYMAASGQPPQLVTLLSTASFAGEIADSCRASPGASLLEVVAELTDSPMPVMAAAAEAPMPAPEPMSPEEEARALLEAFLDPQADRVTLTARLKPTPDDVRAVYSAPLAERLVMAYAATFQPGIAIGPKPGQTEVTLTASTTHALRDGAAELSDFPGGYRDVLGFFAEDVPIVRFRFVEPGQELGLSFDGLVKVHGRWVLMPKPWRMLN